MNPKVIALFLPQFYKTPENDAWWGEGFTDWVSAREAKPLYEGHIQPHLPADGNFYDLSRPETLAWQAELANQYGIYGFAMYHYYFGKGRMILTKPAENLLAHPEIDIRFCFDWANESWARTWTKRMEGVNVWVMQDTSSDTPVSKGKQVLLKQEYGDAEDWKAHFDYLLPFFKDHRYIKYEGKPVIILYRPELIWCLERMMDFWQQMAKENGFPGLYVIGETTNVSRKLATECDARMLRFPDAYLRNARAERSNPSVYSFSEISMYSFDLLSETLKDGTTIPCFGPGIDTTPRRGPQGIVIKPHNVKTFQTGLSNSVFLTKKFKVPYLFLNAWNEWGEGMYLEPDTEKGFGYLRAVKESLSASEVERTEVPKNYYREKYFRLMHDDTVKAELLTLMDDLLDLRNQGVCLGDALADMGFHHVAIYGWGRMGTRLASEIDGTKTEVSYVIDRDVPKNSCPYPLYRVEEELPDAELVIISPIGLFDLLKPNIAEKISGRIVSASNLIREIYSAYC